MHHHPQPDDRFFIIWSPQGKTPPSVTHYSSAVCDIELRRLAELNPGQQFYKCVALERVEVPVPVPVATRLQFRKVL